MGCDDDHYILFEDDFGTMEEQEEHGRTGQMQTHSSSKIIYKLCKY